MTRTRLAFVILQNCLEMSNGNRLRWKHCMHVVRMRLELLYSTFSGDVSSQIIKWVCNIIYIFGRNNENSPHISHKQNQLKIFLHTTKKLFSNQLHLFSYIQFHTKNMNILLSMRYKREREREGESSYVTYTRTFKLINKIKFNYSDNHIIAAATVEYHCNVNTHYIIHSLFLCYLLYLMYCISTIFIMLYIQYN